MLLRALFAFSLFISPAFAQSITPQIGGGISNGFDGGISSVSTAIAGDAAQTTAFLARANAVTTLDATHTNAYKALINGGVADGWFVKLDIFFIFATQSSGVALLNIPNTTYTSSLTATNPTFTADRGYQGNGSGMIQTTYNPSSGGVQFTQNTAHLSAWSNSSAVTDGAPIAGSGANVSIYPRFSSDSNTYVRVNDSDTFIATGQPSNGFFVGVRTSSTGKTAYLNGSSIGSQTDAASALSGSVVTGLGANGAMANSYQISAMSAGGILSPTDISNFYSRLRTYMTAVGVP